MTLRRNGIESPFQSQKQSMSWKSTSYEQQSKRLQETSNKRTQIKRRQGDPMNEKKRPQPKISEVERDDLLFHLILPHWHSFNSSIYHLLMHLPHRVCYYVPLILRMEEKNDQCPIAVSYISQYAKEHLNTTRRAPIV